MVLGYPTSTSFPRVDGWSMDPRVLGCHISSDPDLLQSDHEVFGKLSSTTIGLGNFGNEVH